MASKDAFFKMLIPRFTLWWGGSYIELDKGEKMRKELKSRNKRKWIVGGAVFFGAAALLTTGFATWIVGVNSTKTEGQFAVDVDTVSNSSLILQGTLSGELKLAETAVKNDGTVVNSDSTDGNLDLTFNYSVSWGNGYDPASITGITLEVKAETPLPTGTAVYTKNALTEESITRGTNYITLETTNIALSLANDGAGVTSSGNLYTYAGTATVSFAWGDFFGTQSPAVFYETLAAGITSHKNDSEVTPAKLSDAYMALGDAATSELGAMKTAFAGKTFTIVATIA